jgi:hypothetical protein
MKDYEETMSFTGWCNKTKHGTPVTLIYLGEQKSWQRQRVNLKSAKLRKSGAKF